MRWFKHMSDLPRDEGVARYLDEAGKDRLAAYGFLIFLMEAISSRMNTNQGDDVCSATYSVTHWGRITYSHPNRVRKYLALCEVIGWVQVGFEGGSCKVDVPRMAEWRDEYSRKSGHTPDKVAQSREEQTRSEQRESREEGALSGCLTAEDARLSPPPDFEITEGLQGWAAKNHPSVDINKETEAFKNYVHPRPYKDWNARWKVWIQMATDHQAKRNGSSNQPSHKDQLLNLGQDLGLERRPDETEAEYLDRVEKVNKQRIEDQDL